MSPSVRTDRGFTLIELMLTVAVAATLMAIALPVMTDMTASVKLNEAARSVERELQDARLKAVSANRSLRVRTNCPSTGFMRTVEVLATAADNNANRCLITAYPFPAPDNDIITRPNHDGPVRVVPNGATVDSQVFEFAPDGRVFNVVSGVRQTMPAPITLTVTRQGRSRTVTINGVGKVQLQ